MNLKFPKKYRKSKNKTIIKYCLGKWANIIKLIGYCEICGDKNSQLHGHHIVKRGWRLCTGWFLLKNGLCVCWKCHSKIHDTNFNVVQEYHKKIIAVLDRKGINYDLLHLECKSRGVDLGLIKIALKAVLRKNEEDLDQKVK